LGKSAVNVNVRKYARFVATVVAAVVAASSVASCGGDDDEAGDVEITLPATTIASEGSPTSATGSASTDRTTDSRPSSPSGPSGAQASSSTVVSGPSASGGSGITGQNAETPLSVLDETAGAVESMMRQKYESVRASRNLCDAVNLLFTLPDPTLLFGDEFGKAEVKEYIEMWKGLRRDVESSAPEPLAKSMAPIADVFEEVFATIEKAGYSTSILITTLPKVAGDRPELRSAAEEVKAWQRDECPSDVTFKEAG
jgi:hypothetical protein